MPRKAAAPKRQRPAQIEASSFSLSGASASVAAAADAMQGSALELAEQRAEAQEREQREQRQSSQRRWKRSRKARPAKVVLLRGTVAQAASAARVDGVALRCVVASVGAVPMASVRLALDTDARRADEAQLPAADEDVPLKQLHALCVAGFAELTLNGATVGVRLLQPAFALEGVPAQHPAAVRAVLQWALDSLPEERGDDHSDDGGQSLYTFVGDRCRPIAEAEDKLPKPSVEQPPKLKATLRPYQAAALRWMLRREHRAEGAGADELHPLWLDVSHAAVGEGASLFFSPVIGGVSAASVSGTIAPISGGMLCDEMGLGKTVEVLALILNHRAPAAASGTVAGAAGADPAALGGATSGLLECSACLLSRPLVDYAEKQLGAGDARRCSICVRSKIPSASLKRPSSSGGRAQAGVSGGAAPMAVAAPAASKAEASKDVFNCVCMGEGNGGEDGTMVACDWCGAWSHAWCVGFDDDFDREFDCSSCKEEVEKDAVEDCSATLIICPAALCQQWRMELQRHAPDLTICIYSGVRAHEKITAKQLGQYDVVLSSYKVLAADIHHSQRHDRHTRAGSHGYAFNLSPLVKLKFWRICLDEAQMVERSTAQAAKFANLLQSQYRWVVTGTPLLRGVEDCHGLLQFLGVWPYSEKTFYRKTIVLPDENNWQGARERFHTLLANMMWRLNRADIADQLNLPPQIEHLHTFTLGKVESYAYRKLYTTAREKAQQNLLRCRKLGLRDDDKFVMNELARPFLLLRQACSHFQLGASLGLPALICGKAPISKTQLLDHLQKKSKVEAEEAMRALMLSRNGISGCCLLRGEAQMAIEMYGATLREAEFNFSQLGLRIDPLQQLHTTANLSKEIAEDAPAESAALAAKAQTLRETFFAPDRLLFASEQSKYKSIETQCSSTLGSAEWQSSPWWLEAIGATMQDEWSVSELREVLAAADEEGHKQQQFQAFQNSRWAQLTDAHGLQITLANEIDAMCAQRKATISKVTALIADTSRRAAISAAHCPSCREFESHTSGADSQEVCGFCRATEQLSTYERKLFQVSTDEKRVMKRDEAAAMAAESRVFTAETDAAGARKVSKWELALQFIASRLLPSSPLKLRAAAYSKTLGQLRAEFFTAKEVASAHRELLSRMDEVEMSEMQLQLRALGQQVTREQAVYTLFPVEVDAKEREFRIDETQFKREVQEHKAQMTYLRTLTKDRSLAEEPCQICRDAPKTIVFPCNHATCLECIETIMKRASSKSRIACPFCRSHFSIDKVVHVKAGQADVSAAEGSKTRAPSPLGEPEVLGSWGTKIEHLVALLKRELVPEGRCAAFNHDGASSRASAASGVTPKALVFSQWDAVLAVAAAALTENGIKGVSMVGGSGAARALHIFKTDRSVQVLLLPVKSGSNGLNLTEAQHVVLLEPLLSPPVEAQAISRVNRIGQTCRTFVHRLAVTVDGSEEDTSTIEQGIIALSRGKRAAAAAAAESVAGGRQGRSMADVECLTLGDIRELFRL